MSRTNKMQLNVATKSFLFQYFFLHCLLLSHNIFYLYDNFGFKSLNFSFLNLERNVQNEERIHLLVITFCSENIVLLYYLIFLFRLSVCRQDAVENVSCMFHFLFPFLAPFFKFFRQIHFAYKYRSL